MLNPKAAELVSIRNRALAARLERAAEKLREADSSPLKRFGMTKSKAAFLWKPCPTQKQPSVSPPSVRSAWTTEGSRPHVSKSAPSVLLGLDGSETRPHTTIGNPSLHTCKIAGEGPL